jgi:F-type H+-transporting ATPase subunit b
LGESNDCSIEVRRLAVLHRLAFTVAALLWASGALVCAAQEESSAEKSAESAAAEETATKSDASGHEKGVEPAEHGAGEGTAGHATEAGHGAAGETHGTGAAHGAADHGGGHHDDTDLSHGNASAALPSPADLRFDMSIYSLIVFLILLAVLYKFAWGPISNGLSQREETIARQIEEARVASERASQQLKEYEARLALATEEARGIVAQSRKDAEVARERIVAEAQQAAQKERDKAVADIHSAKNQALREIAEKSVGTAISLASNIIRREVRPEDHNQLIEDSLAKFSKLN